jgi:hypothetical protein
VVGPVGYFKGTMVYDSEAELHATKQCIFGAFPHGVVRLSLPLAARPPSSKTLPSSAHAVMTTLPKVDANCTAPSLIPTSIW